MKEYKFSFWLLGLLACLSMSLQAHEWSIDPEKSRVSFISIKKLDNAEVHHFDKVSGGLEAGVFTLSIPLNSVVTNIEIRDERMKNFLFEVAKFPRLELEANVNPEDAVNLKVGQSKLVTFSANLTLHGVSKLIETQVMVARLAAEQIQVSSFKPIVIRAGDFGLDVGVAKLQEIARLSSISNAVPVTFVLSLSK